MKLGELDHRFAWHPPDAEKVQVYEGVRWTAKQLARYIDGLTPDSREKSLAITHLEEAVMWTNAAIARHGLTEKETE